MEINTQQMEALLHLQEQQAQLPRKQAAPATGFEALLNGQIGQENTEAASNPAAIAGLYPQIMFDNHHESAEQDPDAAVLQAAFEQASGALDLWDSYARTLGTSTTDSALRDAWGLLQGIDDQIAQLRDNPIRARSSALDSILNELEVLATTERFKFNRGDYIS